MRMLGVKRKKSRVRRRTNHTEGMGSSAQKRLRNNSYVLSQKPSIIDENQEQELKIPDDEHIILERTLEIPKSLN